MKMNNFTLYSGITQESWSSTWKDKNLTNKETNATSDTDFAFDYSYNFKTGKYEDLVVEISNIPLEAIIAVRDEDYKDDNDFQSLSGLSNKDKINAINSSSLFVLNLKPYENIIKTTLIDNNKT